MSTMFDSSELRLVLGDQLNPHHPWFRVVRNDVTYVLMEILPEAGYVRHHIQKVVGIFAAMRDFAQNLRDSGHEVIYFRLDDAHNLHSFEENCFRLISDKGFKGFAYQLPDEFRVDRVLSELSERCPVPVRVDDTHHFYTTREELSGLFKGSKTYLMERFYRHMRTHHNVLMEGKKPVTGQWNLDAENRKRLPKGHIAPRPLEFDRNVSDIVDMLNAKGVQTIGSIDPLHFPWPVNRQESLQLLSFFVEELLPLFGTYEDAMDRQSWSLYHSRLSFSLNVKMLSASEVVEAAVQAWKSKPHLIGYNQVEGFVRQILGWREFMRGVYWAQMPAFADLNFFGHERPLPAWFWTGETHMNCLKHVVDQSLEKAYAHHIQRLMVVGNFALLAGLHPDAVDEWFLGIYMDAFQWVEITNTRGMSQYADGGLIASKPYVSSAAYIQKMGNYCSGCAYDANRKTGEGACPFNSLYWHFHRRNHHLLASNPRIGMMYKVLEKMDNKDVEALMKQADHYLENLETL